MLLTGLDTISRKFPASIKGKSVGILCHAPSINRNYEHILEVINQTSDCLVKAIFGPQHGIWGETQDNMIEWEGYNHPVFKVPVYSLYGIYRKPTKSMLHGIECFIIDLQDIGARPYTYVWTVKECMEACGENGIKVIILDRPNPVSGMQFDGPVLKREYYTFVGGAEIPLCHRMTIAEIALWLNQKERIKCDLEIIPLENYDRNSIIHIGYPWVLPSPNMPTIKTAIVYPGMVLTEALNISEGRGTTIPFELFGAPFIDSLALIKELKTMKLSGCTFREHDFIPTFNKYAGEYCHGVQIHVTDPKKYRPVLTATLVYSVLLKICDGQLKFNEPPYEYEDILIPFDILSGDEKLRNALLGSDDITIEAERWNTETELFKKSFKELAIYPLE